MNLSVIIPTYNGAHKLPNILGSLLYQSVKPYEIIIVVDGSTDNTREVLESFQTEIAFLRIIYQENSGRAMVRNTGASNAKGDILLFLDDDMRLTRDGIEKHLAFHRSHPKTILFGRAALDPSKIISDDFSQFRLSCENKWIKEFDKGLNKITLEKYGFTTQNLSCSKKTFEYIGGFDARLNDSEDFDFSLRALDLGIPIYFDYHLLAWHDDYIAIDKYIKRQVQYIESKQLLGQLKPAMKDMHPASFSYGISVSPIKKMVRRFFVLNKIWESTFKSNFYYKLPISVRNKLYSLVINSSVISGLNKNR
jgi:glycosyltransferase involved in cell wall biosynthesis